MTSCARTEAPTSIARHSRVYSSSTQQLQRPAVSQAILHKIISPYTVALLPRQPNVAARATLPVAGSGSPFFCEQPLYAFARQHGFGQQTLELGVLCFQQLQPLGVRYFHPAILLTPAIEGLLRYSNLPTKLRYRLRPMLRFPQNRNDLSSVNRFFMIVLVDQIYHKDSLNLWL
jgi:hypothetical protein